MRGFANIMLLEPTMLAIAVGVAVLVLLLALLLILRMLRRKRENESHIRSEMIAMEREAQFFGAVEHAQFHKTREDGARQAAAIFRDFLSLPVIALYVGREGDQALSNILPPDALQGRQFVSSLPASIPSSFLASYTRPQLTSTAGFFSAPQKSFVGVGRQAGGEAASAPYDPFATGNLAVIPPQENFTVAVLPFRGSFGWSGILIARVQDELNNESILQLQEPMSRLAGKLSVTLELDRLNAPPDDRPQRMARFAATLLAARNSPDFHQTIAHEVAALAGSDSAALWMVDAQASIVKMASSSGLKSTEFLPLPVGQGFAGSIAQSGETLAIEDAPEDARCLFPREAIESGICSYLGAPVISDGNIIGVIEVHTHSPRAWRESDAAILQSVALLIGQILASAPVEPASSSIKAESAYFALSEAFQRLRSRDELLEAAVEVLGHALGVSRALAVTLADSGQVEPVKIEYSVEGVKPAAGAVFNNETLMKLISATSSGEPAVISDSRAQSLMSPDLVTALQSLSEMIIPLRVEGQARGFIVASQCDRQREWGPEEVEFADRVGRQLSQSMTNLRALARASGEAQAAREEVRRAHEAIAQSQGIVNTMAEAVICLDAEGRLTFYNAAAREWLGLKNEDLGKRAQACEALSVNDPNIWPQVNATKSIARVEVQLLRAAGAKEVPGGSVSQGAFQIPASISVAPIRTSKGEMGGHVVVISDARHLGRSAQDASLMIATLQKKQAEMERALAESRNEQGHLKSMLENAQKAYAEAKAEAASASEEELKEAYERLSSDSARLRNSAQQLLEINRLKSEFIVNAGRELESSLQSLIGFVALLEQGSYGPLTREQAEAVESMHAWARRMKLDVDALIDYGTTRSRKLDSSNNLV